MNSPIHPQGEPSWASVLEGARGATGSLVAAVWLREGDALRLRSAKGLEDPLVQVAFYQASPQADAVDLPGRALDLIASPSARAVIEGGLPLLGAPVDQLARESEAPPQAVAALAHVLSRYRLALYPLASGEQPWGMVGYVLPWDQVRAFQPALEAWARQIALAVQAARAGDAEPTSPSPWVLGRDERARADFLAAVAHELKTPLTYVKNAAVLLGHKPYLRDPSTAAELTQTVAAGLARLSRRVDGFLDLASPAAAAPGELRELGPLVREGVESVQRLAQDRQQRLTLELPPAPVYGLVREDRYLAALQNVLENAIKYTPTGGRVSVRLTAEEGRAVARVADSGPGVPPELWERVFEPFFRRLPRASGGLGLGLTIARSSLRAMGGGLWIESSSPQGTTFVLAVRIAAADESLDAE